MPAKRNKDHESVAIGSVWWIWDSVFEEPREVKVTRALHNERHEFLCWDTYETEPRGCNGHCFLHQIYKKNQLFPTKAALCDYYIKKFQKFKEK